MGWNFYNCWHLTIGNYYRGKFNMFNMFQFGGNKEALNWLTQMNFLNLDNKNRFASSKSETFLHTGQSVEWKIMITTMSLHSKQVNNFKLEFTNLKRHSFPKA